MNAAKDVFLTSAKACIENGDRLLGDAEGLEFAERPATTFALAIIAQEEFAKGYLLMLVARNVIPWHPLIYRASRDHVCKQLLGIVMEYLNPDVDEFRRRLAEWREQHGELEGLLASLKDDLLNEALRQRLHDLSDSIHRLPPCVADAISMLRWEKIGRWDSLSWEWADEPQYDPAAQMIGEGSVDREKQDALYVRLSRSGQVVGTPDSVAPDTATEAMKRAERFGQLVKSMFSESPIAWEYERVEQIIALVFQDLANRIAKSE